MLREFVWLHAVQIASERGVIAPEPTAEWKAFLRAWELSLPEEGLPNFA